MAVLRARPLSVTSEGGIFSIFQLELASVVGVLQYNKSSHTRHLIIKNLTTEPCAYLSKIVSLNGGMTAVEVLITLAIIGRGLSMTV